MITYTDIFAKKNLVKKGELLGCSIPHVHTIQWAFNTLNIFRTINAYIAELLVHSHDRVAPESIVDWSRFPVNEDEGVSQSMNNYLFYNSCMSSYFFKNLLHVPLSKMSTRRLFMKKLAKERTKTKTAAPP